MPVPSSTPNASGRRSRARLLAPTIAIVLSVSASTWFASREAHGLLVYGAPQSLSGEGGCVRDPLAGLGSEPTCTGSADGLAGAQALAVSPDGANVYVAGEDAVTTLAREGASGALRPALSPSARACTAAAAGEGCALSDPAVNGADAVAVSAGGGFVYVGSSTSASVSAFARGPSGVLVPLTSERGGYSGCVSGVALAGSAPSRCAAFDGALSSVDALAISPDGRYLYAVSSGLAPGEDSIVALRRDPASGALRPLPGTRGCVQSLPGRGCPAVAGLEGASAIAISANGRFVYIASALSGAVRGFERNGATGALTPMFGLGGCISSDERAAGDVPCVVKVPQLAGARSIALSPDGRELYVAAFDPGAVVTLTRDPATGRLGVGPPSCLVTEPDADCPTGVASLRGAAALALTPDGAVLYVIGESANSLVEVLRDPSDGGLTLGDATPTTVPELSGAIALALSPGGQSVYVASPFDDGVAALTR